MILDMRCYYVLVHGKLKWRAGMPDTNDSEVRPAGFYCHRYVLASGEEEAAAKAFRRVRANLGDWLQDDVAILNLEVEEVSVAPIHKLMKPDNRGHSFYERN